MLDEPLFQLCFGILVLEAKEFQHERIFDGLFGRDCVAGVGGLCLLEHGSFVPRKCDAFIKLATDLPVKLPNGPPRPERLGLVKGSRFWTLDGKQPDVGGPRQSEAGRNIRDV